MKKTLLILAGFFFIFCLLIFRPIPIPNDEKDLIAISGTVSEVYEGGVKDAVFRLEEYQGRMFYINRGLENELNLEELKNNLIGKKVTLKYPDYWTLFNSKHSNKHVCILEHEGKVLYSELD